MELYEIKNIVTNIEELSEGALNKKELQKLVKKCRKIRLSLIHLKQAYRKQKIKIPDEFNFLTKQVKKIEKELRLKIEACMTIKKEQNNITEKPANTEYNQELTKLRAIIESNFSQEEKISKLEDNIIVLKNKIECLDVQKETMQREAQENFIKSSQNAKAHKSKKERLESKKAQINGEKKKSKQKHYEHNEFFRAYLENIKKIKEITKNRNGLVMILKLNQNALLKIKEELIPKIEKEKVAHKKEIKLESKPKNNPYYFIILNLLDNDKYFLYLKKLITEKEEFQNARQNGKHIIFDILDKYIENKKLELVNHKLVHINPEYYYSLLKVFMNSNMELSVEENIEMAKIITGFLEYINRKNYKQKDEIRLQFEKLYSEHKQNQEQILNPRLLEINLIDSLSAKNRVNFIKEDMLKIHEQVQEYKNRNADAIDEITTKEISRATGLSRVEIRNANYIGNTYTFENQKYAYSLGYDKEYNLFFRIHVIDTTVIDEETNWGKEIERAKETNSPLVNKVLSYKKGRYYPTITYQLKIRNDGVVGSFKIYPSKIKIDEKIDNSALYNYREDEEIKALIGYMRVLASNYDLELENLDNDSIERVIDSILSLELRYYFEKNNLSAIYFAEFAMSEKEKIAMHWDICESLNKVSKQEAHKYYNYLRDLKSGRFYTTIPAEECQIVIDPRNYLGYLNLKILKSYLRDEPNEVAYYEMQLKEVEKTIENDELFKDYFHKRQLIRKQKAEMKSQNQ